MIPKTDFPCWESPLRCYLSSLVHDRRLSSNNEGAIWVSENRQAWEEWYIQAVALDKTDDLSILYFHIKSSHHGGRYLYSDNECSVYTCFEHEQGDSKLWSFEKYSKGVVIIKSKVHNRQLACDGTKAFTCDEKQAWKMEFLTDNASGWEVWRFIESGDEYGSVILSSWTHTPKCIASSPDGSIWISDNPLGDWEKWIVEKSLDPPGVVLRSLSHGRVLSLSNSNSLYTLESISSESIWNFKPANQNKFYVAIRHHNKCLTCTENNIIVTADRGGNSKWEVVIENDFDTVQLQNINNGCRLAADKDGKLYSSQKRSGQDENWFVKISPFGGVFLVSSNCNKNLASDGNSVYVSDRCEEWETWQLEPVLPHTITGNQIVVPIIGSVLLAVIAPFAVMGVVGMLGFTASGIVGGSVAAGMMSAEAIALGGGVAAGGLVATLQSIGVVGLGVFGTIATVGSGAIIGGTIAGSTLVVSGIYNHNLDASTDGMATESLTPVKPKNRPFCAWRSW